MDRSDMETTTILELEDAGSSALVESRGGATMSSSGVSELVGSTGAANLVDVEETAPIKNTVESMWHRADEMKFKERGDRDMTKQEVTEFLSDKTNPFDDLPDDAEDRILEAVKNGDLEALKKIDNVQIYQTYEEQEKEQRGDDYDEDAHNDDQLVLNAKGIWDYFDNLRKLRATITDQSEWDQLLDSPKWARFVRWYPTIAGYAATPNLPDYQVDEIRFMLDQKRMMEDQTEYTRAQADAAMEVYSKGEWKEKCHQMQTKSTS